MSLSVLHTASTSLTDLRRPIEEEPLTKVFGANLVCSYGSHVLHRTSYNVHGTRSMHRSKGKRASLSNTIHTLTALPTVLLQPSLTPQRSKRYWLHNAHWMRISSVAYAHRNCLRRCLPKMMPWSTVCSPRVAPAGSADLVRSTIRIWSA